MEHRSRSTHSTSYAESETSDMDLGARVPHTPSEYGGSAITDETDEFHAYGNATRPGMANMYSDNFDHDDWSIMARPPAVSYHPPTPVMIRSQDPREIAPSSAHAYSSPEGSDETDNRTASTGRSLRPSSSVAKKYNFDPMPPKAPRSKPRAKQITRSPQASPTTARGQIRRQIALVTKAKQDRFLYAHRSLFMPLLPSSSHIVHLGPSSVSTVPYREVAQPKGMNAQLKPYQIKGLSFLVYMHNNGMSSILGDEMGLGKTIQTLSLFQYIKEAVIPQEKYDLTESRPFLVICPLIVLENWVKEASKFTPGMKVLRFHGPVAERNMLKEELRSRLTLPARHGQSHQERRLPYDLVVATYDSYKAENSWFKTVCAWRYVVLDEGHKIKNHTSDISKSLQSLSAEYRVLLTGTPLQNNLKEMWSLLHWLIPDVFTDATLPLFNKSFDLTKGLVDRSVLDNSRKLLELVMLRRMKSSPGVDLGLPPKDVIRLFAPLTPLQKKWYTQILTRQSDDVLEEIYRGALAKEDATRAIEGSENDTSNELEPASKEGDWRRLLNLVMQLRKVCTHPYLIPDAAPGHNLVGAHIYQNSGKFMILYKLIEELVLIQRRKVIIFSSFMMVLDWVQDLITLISDEGAKFECLRMDGNTVRAKRNLYVRLFQKPDSEFRIFLISTKAGGVGLNLTAATSAIFLDEDWNPQVDLQAEARCHRIGQDRPVTIYKLCTAGTVEEQMLGRIHKKLYLSAKITESMQNIHDTHATSTDMNVAQSQSLFGSYSEFKSLLRHGTKTLASDTVDMEAMAQWDFSAMLDNCKQSTEPKESANVDEDEWLSTMERVECAVFEGKRYARGVDKPDEKMTTPLTSRSDRHKGRERTVLIDGFEVDKSTLENAKWEAVSTLAGKDPSLKEVKRVRETFNHFDYCFHCDDDSGTVFCCSSCPRVYHGECLSSKDAQRALLPTWACPHHFCAMCKKIAGNAGGMIFRCRWCPKGYCEDCLDWDSIELVGDQLDEYKSVGYPIKRDAYYIICPECNTPDKRLEQDDKANAYRDVIQHFERGLKYDAEKLLNWKEEDDVHDSIEVIDKRNKGHGAAQNDDLLESIEVRPRWDRARETEQDEVLESVETPVTPRTQGMTSKFANTHLASSTATPRLTDGSTEEPRTPSMPATPPPYEPVSTPSKRKAEQGLAGSGKKAKKPPSAIFLPAKMSVK